MKYWIRENLLNDWRYYFRILLLNRGLFYSSQLTLSLVEWLKKYWWMQLWRLKLISRKSTIVDTDQLLLLLNFLRSNYFLITHCFSLEWKKSYDEREQRNVISFDKDQFWFIWWSAFLYSKGVSYQYESLLMNWIYHLSIYLLFIYLPTLRLLNYPLVSMRKISMFNWLFIRNEECAMLKSY
jgi:hypothetical protein